MPNDPQIVITRLRISNFRGVAKLDVPVGPSGVLFTGTNAAGKTSALESINAALEGVGIGPECIRLGADKSEILVDLDKLEGSRRTKLEAKRTIGKSGTKIAITGSDGVPLPKAKEQLAALFGGRALDPLKFLMADAKEQRRIVLAANPVRVTAEDLTRWTGEEREWNTDGHGQEVLARVRQLYFDQRTKAGQAADQAKAAVAIRQEEADRLRVENPETMTPDAARTHVAAAERELAILFDRRKQAEQREEAASGQRAKIAELRTRAEELLARDEATPPTTEEMDKADGWLAMLKDQEKDLEEKLAEVRAQITAKLGEQHAMIERKKKAGELLREAEKDVAQANEIEQALAINTLDGDGDPIAMQAVAAEEALESARALVARAESSAKWRAANDAVTAADAIKVKADAEWEKLNTTVKRLTEQAPAEIAARADLIEGLEVTPDAILLDGKDITVLCGAEKARFAVSLAKRVAGKAKILTVDKMEQLAPENQPAFVRMCLEDGWMLFAAVACDGPLQVLDCYQFAEKAA